MATNHQQLILVSAVFLLIGSAAAAVPDDCGIAVYWGQNGYEGSLKEACDSNNYKYVALGFLSLSGPTPDKAFLNLGSHCDPSNGGCVSLGEEIKHCQSKNITVLLSITGGVSNDVPPSAEELVKYLKDTYLNPLESNSGPFGGARVDGFDLAVTHGSWLYYYNLAWGLKEDNGAYLTASPPCTLPNYPLDTAMRAGLFNKIWVQFYNSPSCDFNSGLDNLVSVWNRWMQTTSPVSGIFLGLPASPEAAATGYVDPSILNNEILPRIRYSDRYGGVALWNRFYDIENQYSAAIKAPVCDYTSVKGGRPFISQVV